MLQELRESIIPPLSRSQLADLIGRSPGYVQKAESLTFPHVPPSLLEFYTNKLGYPRNQLVAQYRHNQRNRRHAWLSYWRPVVLEEDDNVRTWNNIRLSEVGEKLSHWPLYLRLTHCWVSQYQLEVPTEYAVSQGLCIPAAAVYNLEKTGKVADSIKVALGDLVEFCESGEVYAQTHLSTEQVEDVLAICDHFRSSHGIRKQVKQESVSVSIVS